MNTEHVHHKNKKFCSFHLIFMSNLQVILLLLLLPTSKPWQENNVCILFFDIYFQPLFEVHDMRYTLVRVLCLDFHAKMPLSRAIKVTNGFHHHRLCAHEPIMTNRENLQIYSTFTSCKSKLTNCSNRSFSMCST